MTSYLRIKICGINNEADGCQAGLLGADAIGLNFYEKSPRYISPSNAEFVLRELPPFVEPVGIFVGQQLHPVFEITDKLGLRTIQLHGASEGIILGNLTPIRLIQPFSLAEKDDLLKIKHYLDRCRQEEGRFPAAILVDSHVPGQYGGTGKTAPWNLLADFRPGVPVILAGGLTPENVAEAIRIVRPYGVDVASGVEKSPGQKDADKMKRFIDNAREAAAK
jgi:phosphoribosylanthranilate isomerase